MAAEKRIQKKWFRLDTAALIFPAITRRDWCNVFRVSADFADEVDPEMLQQAVNDLRPRFPQFYLALNQGLFWYYLEEIKKDIRVREDYAYPLTFMSRREVKKAGLRVLYYKNRIAVEFFHSLTDGRGGITYLCNLAARYTEIRYHIKVPTEKMIFRLSDKPDPEEYEDSFLKNAAPVAASRKESVSYHLKGRKEKKGFKHLTTGIVDTAVLLEEAHKRKVSVTSFLAGVMAESIISMQEERRSVSRRKPVKITIPVDLRRLYGSRTLRNFSLVLNPGVDPRFGSYTLNELCDTINHQLRAYATKQNMAGMIAANVKPQQLLILRLAPVQIKNIVMDLVYGHSGESSGSINISNLGNLELPEAMKPYVNRMEFIIGPQRSYPNNCSVLSYQDKTCINMIRNIRETELERRFFSRLVDLGIPVEIETNRRE
ncbi:MAG: hypothetical protein IJL98_06765 [Lachnospiraceae bacterium]|nr:hypothetical protein [Lachnospiraceae bacterium]